MRADGHAVRRRRFRCAIIGAVAAAVLAVGFLAYAADFYHADPQAAALARTDATIVTDGGLTILPGPTGSTTGFIFYPGAKVEADAYLPILEAIRQACGVTCVLVRMPFNMAIFDRDAADGAMARLPQVRRWYVGGHSMGGAMASAYAAGHHEKAQGLILMGAYLYGDYPGEHTLVIYGSLDAAIGDHLRGTEHVVCIPGGNHAQFGDYGPQRGDATAEISRRQQQEAAVAAVAQFMKDDQGAAGAASFLIRSMAHKKRRHGCIPCRLSVDVGVRLSMAAGAGAA